MQSISSQLGIPQPGQPLRSTSSWISDPRIRSWVAQTVAVVCVVALGWYLLNNAAANLAQRGITSGFGFLDNAAGFGISQHLIEYTESSTYGRVFLIGLLNTLLVAGIGIVLATIIGFVLGVARLSSNWLIRNLAGAYIETFRNIPPLLQVFFWYFAVLSQLPGPRQSMSLLDVAFLNNRGLQIPAAIPTQGAAAFGWALVLGVIGIFALHRWARRRRHATGQPFPVLLSSIAILLVIPGLSMLVWGTPVNWEVPELNGFNFHGGWVVIPELVAIVLALSIYTAAFIGETVRSGIQAINHGQTEAAQSLGLRPGKTMRLVIIPQALRIIIPPLTNQYLNLAKNSSLAAAIGYPDMVSLFAGTVLNQTGQAIETMVMTMSVYLAISLGISLLMNLYNKRIALIER